MSSSSSRARRIAASFRSPADVLLALRVLGWALVLPVTKHVLPIRALVRFVWRHPRFRANSARHARVVLFARWACRATRWRSGGNCLERGLIAYRFLLEGGAEPTLVVGFAKGASQELLGHAWVLLDGRPAGESLSGLQAFTPVFSFGPDGTLTAPTAAPGVADALPPVR